MNSQFRATFTAEGNVQVSISECGVQRDVFRLVRWREQNWSWFNSSTQLFLFTAHGPASANKSVPTHIQLLTFSKTLETTLKLTWDEAKGQRAEQTYDVPENELLLNFHTRDELKFKLL